MREGQIHINGRALSKSVAESALQQAECIIAKCSSNKPYVQSGSCMPEDSETM